MGLRLLPFWQEAIRRGLLGSKAKCETCMESLSEEQRQLAGCGYLPPPAERLRVFVQPWAGLGYAGPAPTECPGYLTNLPEVIEAARGWSHWSKGSLPVFTRGVPSEALVDSIEHFNGAINECQSWCAENPEKR
jgi:hypothetical protein